MNVLINKNELTECADNSFVPEYGGSSTRSPLTPAQIKAQIQNATIQQELHELAKTAIDTNKAVIVGPYNKSAALAAKHVIVTAANGVAYDGKFMHASYLLAKHLTAFYSKDANLRKMSGRTTSMFYTTDTIEHIYTDALTASSNWGAYATKKGNTSLVVHYGVTEEEYLELVDSYTPPTTT